MAKVFKSLLFLIAFFSFSFIHADEGTKEKISAELPGEKNVTNSVPGSIAETPVVVTPTVPGTASAAGAPTTPVTTPDEFESELPVETPVSAQPLRRTRSNLNVVLPIGLPFSLTENQNAGGSSKDTVKTEKKTSGKKKVYTFDLKDEIGPPAWRQTKTAFERAKEMDADYVIIHMNTFGGAVDAADNIRTSILEFEKPVFVFIDKNAASAGALISIACDSIYMSKGSSFGAATVVDQQGNVLAEKYQSYMRSILRSTAEANKRDPKIAEGMNDPRIYIQGVKDSGKVITFTSSEAIANNYCEGEAGSISEVLQQAGINNYEIISYKPSSLEKMIHFLLQPAISGILIMVIIAGIYFEMQSPGIGFPLFAAIGAAVLYFAPLYLEGLARHWEIGLFILGVLMVLVELFAIPGFGVLGISGLVCIVLGLSLSLVGSLPTSDSPISFPDGTSFVKAVFIVVISMVASISLSFWLGGKFFKSHLFSKVVLQKTQDSNEGYVSTGLTAEQGFKGKTGKAYTILRPAGKVLIEGDIFDATAELGYIEKDEPVEVLRFESSQLVVKKAAKV